MQSLEELQQKENETAIMLLICLFVIHSLSFALFLRDTCLQTTSLRFLLWLAALTLLNRPSSLIPHRQNRTVFEAAMCPAQTTHLLASTVARGGHMTWFWPMRGTWKMLSGASGKLFKRGQA